jgi:hypothetical protein
MPSVWSKPFITILNSYTNRWRAATSSVDRDAIVTAVINDIQKQLLETHAGDSAPPGLEKVRYTKLYNVKN